MVPVSARSNNAGGSVLGAGAESAAGPVYSGHDPIIGKMNYYGSHVNRAARIEPVTIPGCAFLSEQFAALLAIDPARD